jgi:GT2 family glycosyltransferase
MSLLLLLQTGLHLEQLFGARFIYVVNQEPLGFGAAANRGMKAATGEFVVLANNHM